MCHRKASDGDEVRAMNPVLRKRAEQYLLSESVSHKEWRALVVEMLEEPVLANIEAKTEKVGDIHVDQA